MRGEPNSVWIVAREYAGIAEAGGVKNVTCSLAEALARAGKEVTVFLPNYGFISDLGQHNLGQAGIISIGEAVHSIQFLEAKRAGVRIVLVDSPIFASKKSVYVYAEGDAPFPPGTSRGRGYLDTDLMNMLLQRAVIYFAESEAQSPDILHCQDAHTALLPALIRTNPPYARLFPDTACLVTIHNAGPGYRQTMGATTYTQEITGIPQPFLGRAVLNGLVEPFLLAASFAAMTTVSPWYADELVSHRFSHQTDGLSGEFERRKTDIQGITNGIDFGKYDPGNTAVSLLPFPFDPSTGNLRGKYQCREALLNALASDFSVPGIARSGSIEKTDHGVYFGYHGRIAHQKGIDTLIASASMLLQSHPNARFLLLGQGDPELEEALRSLTLEFPGRAVYLRGYERALARLVVASSDFLVLPSVFEPCGLEDLIGQLFGTIPVAHAVGGLQKITHGQTGFLYRSIRGREDRDVLYELLSDLTHRATLVPLCSQDSGFLEIIQQGAQTARRRYDWDRIVENEYLPLYRRIRI